MLIYQLLLLFCFNFHLQRTLDQFIRFSNTALSHTENEHTQSLIVRHNTKQKFTTKNKSLFPPVSCHSASSLRTNGNLAGTIHAAGFTFKTPVSGKPPSKHFHLVTVFFLRVISILTSNRIFMSVTCLVQLILLTKSGVGGCRFPNYALKSVNSHLEGYCAWLFSCLLFVGCYSLLIVSTNFCVTEIVF